ncbi:hypothetical protein N7453_001395 [Penicillium expansum]|nr:hypothetical protein N7453_001395 [Penicillium expansum]
MGIVKPMVNNIWNRFLGAIRAQVEEGQYASCWFVAFLAFLVKKYRPKKSAEEEAKYRLPGEVDRLSQRVEELEVGRAEELRALKEEMARLEEKLGAGRGYL